MKISVPLRAAYGAIGELAGKPQSPRRRLPADLLFLLAAETLFGTVDHPIEQTVRLRRVSGQPMVEGVAHGALDDAGGLRACEPVLGLALELGLADEQGQHGGRRAEHVVGRQLADALMAGELAIAAQALGERGAQSRFMRSAVRRRHGVAIGAQEAVVAGDPGDRPFDRAGAFGFLDPSREHVFGDGLLAFDAARQEILEPAGEVKDGALGRLAVAGEQSLGARPSDFDAAEEIGLRARHAEQPRRLEGGALAEDLGVGPEADARAAAVLDRAEALQAGRQASPAYSSGDRASGRAPPRLPSSPTARWRPRRRRRVARRSSHRPWS